MTGDGTGAGHAPGQIPLGALGELVGVFNDRYGEGLGETDALRVMEDVRDTVRDENGDLEARQAPTRVTTSLAIATTS